MMSRFSIRCDVREMSPVGHHTTHDELVSMKTRTNSNEGKGEKRFEISYFNRRRIFQTFEFGRHPDESSSDLRPSGKL
jgi:hypothetical protein